MKGLARPFALVMLAVASLCAVANRATATPLADVPANHWAYQAIESLAADGVIAGYPDGYFKGDRPLTRYEMAVIVARTIARLQQTPQQPGPSREDLDKLQKLIDALKDELDALGVRVTALEDSVADLNRRTKTAQSLTLHGIFLPDVVVRQNPIAATTVTNTTGAPVTTYYGATVPADTGAAKGAVGPADPFLTAFLSTDDSNNPFTQALLGISIRQDTRFSLAYAIDDNLTVSLPVHILNFEYGGTFAQQGGLDIEPGVRVDVAHAGALSNVSFEFGEIDDMTSSRLGLAFRAPQGYDAADPYEQPAQPFEKGVELRGTVGEGAFGLTDVEASFTRMDDVLLDTQPGVTSANVAPFEANGYLFPVVAPQETYTQTTPAAALRTDTFNSGAGTLTQVYLTQKAVNGSVYVSGFDGATFNASGGEISGPALSPPPFTFNDAYNSVVFAMPLPPGSTIEITYRGLELSDNSSFERYLVHVRANQHFKGYTGAEVGLSYDRIFDTEDVQTQGSGATAFSVAAAPSPDGAGLVSDAVFGLDFQAPIPAEILGPGSSPVIFGEFAGSSFTPDSRTIAAVGDGATALGVKFGVGPARLSAQYQSVGPRFFVGAPVQYFGNVPALYGSYGGNYFPDFFGFGNTVAINREFDSQFTNAGAANPGVLGNPDLTFAYPIADPLRAQGPSYFSAFTPNTAGPMFSLEAPIRIGGLTLSTTGSYQHLEEVTPSTFGSLAFGPTFTTSVPERSDSYGLNTKFALPIMHRSATISLSGQYETLQRLDATAQQYYPIDLSTGGPSAAAYAAAQATFPVGGPFGNGGSAVSYYPNYINLRHITLGAAATIPLTRDLQLNGSYSTQRYGGSDGTTLTQNISERKDYLTGGVTYNIPKTNSSISLLARHYGYTDQEVQNFNFSENRQDLNFTVRF